MRIVAGDIGGTNARLVYVQDGDVSAVRYEKTYPCTEHSTLTAVIEDFVSFYEIKLPLDRVCLAVAGPVVSGRASLTNVPWEISEAALSKVLKTANVCLINDLVAAAYAVPDLRDDEVVVLQQGMTPHENETHINAAVLGIGTGLGAAHLIWEEGRYRVLSSEAGHASFAPVNEIQQRLLSWLHLEHTHVSAEMLLSGRGITALYQFFRDELGVPESSTIREAMLQTDSAQVIGEHAVAADDELCLQTLTCFVDILAAVAGDITLHYYPVNALYLVGGIPPKIASLLIASDFSESFSNKGPRHDDLKCVSVKLVTSDSLGLDGAIAYARSTL